MKWREVKKSRVENGAQGNSHDNQKDRDDGEGEEEISIRETWRLDEWNQVIVS